MAVCLSQTAVAHMARTSLRSRWHSPARQLRGVVQTGGRPSRMPMQSITNTSVSAPTRPPKQSAGDDGKHKKTIVRPRRDQLTSTFTSAQLAYRYGYPILKEKTKRWVAIIELGGGYLQSDLEQFCEQVGIPVPDVEVINVGGATGVYKKGDPADGEYALDIQVIAGATMGQVGLLLVNAPNPGTALALETINNFKMPAGHELSAVSLSWGLDERKTGRRTMESTDKWLRALLDKGIPTFCSSGDNGSSDNDFGLNVDYPASSPFAFGCGGTRITLNDIVTEVAWSGSGGGLSRVYPVPPWQEPAVSNAGISNRGMRCVPDASADADPQSGYTVIIEGEQDTIGGTSAVSPMWAAWKAATDAVAGKTLKFSAQRVYELADLTDITIGSNGAFPAGPGYDLVTGVGVPNEEFTKAWLQRGPNI